MHGLYSFIHKCNNNNNNNNNSDKNKFVECIFYTNIQMCFSNTKRKKAIKSSKIKVTTTVAKNFSNF